MAKLPSKGLCSLPPENCSVALIYENLLYLFRVGAEGRGFVVVVDKVAVVALVL